MTIINQVLLDWKSGELHGGTWMTNRGLSLRGALAYCNKEILKKVGPSIFMKGRDDLSWEAVVCFIQQELKTPLHIGGKTALELQGISHYASLSAPNISLISFEKKQLPKWVRELNAKFQLSFRKSSILPHEDFLIDSEVNSLSLKLSCRELAVLELIDTTDLKNDFETVENYMNSLITLRPSVVQSILEQCRSVKAKRVFLYLAEKLELPFYSQLDQSKIDLGSGKRVIAEQGTLNRKYNITVPREHEDNPF